MKLSDTFAADQIRWRPGSMTKDKSKAVALAYIDARDVMDRLDQSVGPENWQCRYPFAGCCELGIKVGDHWVWKTNGADETNIEGVKGQFSRAFVRAGVMWGIGRYLYDLPNRYYPLGEYGRFSDATIDELSRKYAAWLDWRKQKGE
jgi:hypothetical protein